MADERLVVLDVETGGVDPKVHALTQIALIACDRDWHPLEELELKLHFDPRFASEEALKLNGFDPALWAVEAHHPRAACDEISGFLRRHSTLQLESKRNGRKYYVAQLVAHNGGFDTDFLFQLFRDPWRQVAGEPPPNEDRSVFCPAFPRALDTLQLAQWAIRIAGAKPPENMKLQTLAAWLGIDPGNAHDALADARVARAIAQRITARFAYSPPEQRAVGGGV